MMSQPSVRLWIQTDQGLFEQLPRSYELSGHVHHLTFELGQHPAISLLRVAPLPEMGVIKLETLHILDIEGKVYDDLPYRTNALYQRDTMLIFETNTPYIDIETTSISAPQQLVIQMEHLTSGAATYRYIAAEQAAMIAAKDQEIQQHAQSLWAKDAEIFRQQERIRAIENTFSWRLTKPLRAIWLRNRLDTLFYAFSRMLSALPLKFTKIQGILLVCERVELAATTLIVSGWGLAASGIARIDLYVDGTFIGQAEYGESRKDVHKAYPFIKQSEHSGFYFCMDVSEYADSGKAEHVIVIKAVSHDGQTHELVKSYQKNQEQFWMPPALKLPDTLMYQQWYMRHQCQPKVLRNQHKQALSWKHAPLISLIVPTYNSRPDWLDDLLRSIHEQSYPTWEGIIVDDASTATAHLSVITAWLQRDSRFRLVQHPARQGVSNACQTGLQEAQGVYCGVVDHDDLLEPQALFEMARSIREKQPDVIYSDELIMFEDGTLERCEFRPDFNYDFFLSHPYIVHLTLFRRELALSAGGFAPNLQLSQDYDLLLRLAVRTRSFDHLPKALYRWRTHARSTGHVLQDSVMAQSIASITQHLRLSGIPENEAWVEPGLRFNYFRVRYAIPPVKLSVIIPTRNRADLLQVCLESFQQITRIPNGVQLEYLIVDNGTTCSKTLKYLDQLGTEGYRILKIPGKFNFSALNNQAVAQSTGDFLLFMNNDLEIVEPGWLEAMLELMSRKETAVVGAKLVYPRIGLIQHTGVLIGIYGAAWHDHQFFPEYESDGQVALGHAQVLPAIRECLAVTAACMLVRRSAFEAAGGFDEQFCVGFGDADLCLRIRAQGYKTLITPYARLIHHESATRGYRSFDPHPVDTAFFVKRWVHLIKEGDLFYNRNLTVDGDIFAPRL